MLLEQLQAYGQTDVYPFHMPGHKRMLHLPMDAYHLDITEIEGFDNLHHAQGILKEEQQKYADFVGVRRTFFLVNGSSCGILAAISAAVSGGGRLLLARNSHKAAYHALKLRGLNAHSSVLLSSVDEKIFKRLGMYLTCEAKYESENRIYHR